MRSKEGKEDADDKKLDSTYGQFRYPYSFDNRTKRLDNVSGLFRYPDGQITKRKKIGFTLLANPLSGRY